jgi:hypothetical protein
MNYILIFVFLWSSGHPESTSQSVKFHSLKACQAAALEIRKQAAKEAHKLPILVCAAEHL